VAVQKFLKTGGNPPAGLKTVGRWHVPGSILGWHLLEGDDPMVVAQHVAEWADMIELEVNPVIEDAAAAEAASKGFRRSESASTFVIPGSSQASSSCRWRMTGIRS
jgi:Protein of unknown function (DUF3303)